MPTDMAYRETKPAYVDKAHVQGKEQRGAGQPQNNQGKGLTKQGDFVKNDAGKAIGEGAHQCLHLLIETLRYGACGE